VLLPMWVSVRRDPEEGKRKRGERGRRGRREGKRTGEEGKEGRGIGRRERVGERKREREKEKQLLGTSPPTTVTASVA